MAIDRNDADDRQARLDRMIEEFRAAQKRRLTQRGIALGNRAEATHQVMSRSVRPTRDETDC
jgi:hypothetical protein